LGDQSVAAILWRGKWLIVIAVVVGALLALVDASLSTRVYEASTTIQVNTGATGSASAINPADVELANQNVASTYATLITDKGFLTKITPSVDGGKLTPDALASQLSAHAITGTSLIDVVANGSSPAEARRVAHDVAQAFVANVQSQAVQTTKALQRQIQSQIAQLTAQVNRARRSGASADDLSSLTGARSELVRQQATITANEIAAGNSLQITAPPTGPTAPVRPRKLLDLIAGVLVGLLVGCGLAWLRAVLDRGLHSSAEAEELLGVPALATIPVRRRYSTDDPVLGEAFDLLRANLAFLAHDRELQVLTQTSFNPGEGKSSTVEGLAHAAVRGGMNVLMIDGDVRTHSLSNRLGYGTASGLTSAIVGMTDPGEAVIELAPGLSLLPSGPTPPNPPSLLSSGAMRDLLAWARERYQLVVIDSPPVAHLADASLLASMSDGIVVVARVGMTKRSDLPELLSSLRQVPVPIVGVVTLDQREIDETYYPAVSTGVRPVHLEPVPPSADAAESF
jgi:tyrosine-protein kinase